MTILGTGVDLVHIERFRALKHPERVAAFYLSSREWKSVKKSRDFAQGLAVRFACKEAVIKAAPDSLSPLDFEIVKHGKKPFVRLHTSHQYAMHVSMAHEGAYACAVALCAASS